MQRQTIAIIGASGSMGSAISKSLAKGNYRLILCSSSTDKIRALTKEIKKQYPAADIINLNCSYDASWEADIIILAVPYSAESAIASKIKDVANQKIVVSISNPVNADFNELAMPADSSAAEELQKLLPHSKIVKAFNTTFAADFAQPVIDGKQVDALVAGNDDEAVETIVELVKTAGFQPIVTGKICKF